jgi:nicotinamidase/pyrazinamidase
MKTGVIVTDIQEDFTELKRGSLAVKGTDQRFIEKVLAATKMLKEKGFTIFATQDWHPINHISFYTTYPGKKAFEIISRNGKEQILWPPHCVQGSEGAKILLDEKLFDVIVRKGTQSEFESYSGFQDDGGNKTPLHRTLQTWGIERLIICGIATDYCVRSSSLDAAALGYQVVMVKDLSRGVAPKTTNHALEEMKQRGVIVLNTLSKKEFK